MTSPDLPTLSFTTPRDLTYHYVHLSPPATSTKPSILILHGFPSIPTDFTAQISHLNAQGHGIIAPFLLGYHPTSSPKIPDQYRLKLISADLISLLDHLQVTSAIHAIGHDWGSTLLSRLEYYYPTRVLKLAYLTIAPTPFGQPFDLDAVNNMTEEALGYAGYGYQKFIMDNLESGRAAGKLEGKHGRMEMLMFADDSESIWRKYWGRIGGLEEWLEADEEVRIIEGVTNDDLKRRKQTLVGTGCGENGDLDSGRGYSGALQWYVCLNRDLNLEDERGEKPACKEYVTRKKVLVVLAEKDPIALPAIQTQMAMSYVENPDQQLVVKSLKSGHFLMFEQKDQLNKILEEFFH